MILSIRKHDEDLNDEIFRKFSKVHPLSINIYMIISSIEYIKWISLATWIIRDYNSENILKKYLSNDQYLKNNLKFSCIFQHDQGRAHMATATTELLKEYNFNFIEYPPNGGDLNPIDFCFGEIQRQAKE
jgi:hypothetical protein